MLNIFAFIILIILMIIFFGKKRLHNIEDNTYGWLLIVSFFTIATGITLGFLLDADIVNQNMMIIIFNKLYLVGLITTLSMFVFYTYNISRFYKEEKRSRNMIIYSIFIACNIIVISLLPLNTFMADTGVMTKGLAMDYTSLLFGIIYTMLIIFCLIDFKHLKNKKYIPIILLILEGIAITIIQFYIPSANFIINPSMVITCLIMYFTIENPDLKTIKDLNKTKKELEDSDSAKTKFLYNISHEIRTPLTNIIGFTDSLKEKNIDGSAKSDVENIEASANNLLEVVNKILDLSKFDKNSIKLDPKTYDLKAMLDEIADFSKEVIGNKKVQFRTSFDTELPKALKGDYKVFRQIILNIIANSIERTDAGYIEFSATTINKGNSSRIIISVEDTGGTMSQNRLDKIFVSKSSKLSKESMLEGVVADLPSTYKLVKLMNGEIMAQNVYERGLKITVAIDQEFVNIEKDKQDEKIEEKDISGKRILIVDDNTLNIKVAERLLKKYNVEVVSVTSGKECLDLINNGAHYDMILMDDMMPGMSGVETFKELKKNTGFKTPTVMLTANAVDGMREKYVLEDGFDEYIAKPIAKVELDRVINKIFR